MESVLVAVDSGGTASKAVLRDGDEIIRFENAATLSGYLDPTRIGDTMRAVLAPIADARRSSGAPVVIRIAAAGFVPGLRDVFRSALESVVVDMFDGDVAEASVANDAVALLVGHEADGVVIAGTGSNVLMRGPGGEIVQCGGHDWVAADDGSAFWVALHAVRRVARDVEDGRGSVLVDAFRRAYATSDVIGTFRELAVAGPRMKADIARFAPWVCAAAASGDAASGDIVDSQADALADLVSRGLRRRGAGTGTASVVECGGLFSDLAFRGAVERRVEERVDARIEWLPVRDGLSGLMSDARWDVDLGDHSPLIVRSSAARWR